MSEPSRASRAPWPAKAFVGVLVLMLGLNGFMWWHNQRTFVPEDRPRLVPRNIESVVKKNNYWVVATTFHMYYSLRALEGATLVLPERMAGHRFAYEHVTRLTVEMVPNVAVVPLELVELLRTTKLVNLFTAIDSGTPLDVVVIPETARYILVTTADEKNWLILPEPMYRQALRLP